ncbi:cold shock domain-containing protein [Kineococcus aurantiacus]|uniref:Cold shock CspA family protein n=1 Tax=Kineococcus aurantiacus TaxID=37633 RepID=A0A7Y9DML5_9ACTN|nr:cold shock CspA family protein [Kineococcus aurantiacus]
MSSRGTVRAWHDDEGWGVLDSPDTPGGCWVHVSQITGRDGADPREGEEVEFTFEAVPDQDGYRFRAVRAWPWGASPRRRPGTTVFNDRSGAFSSTLTLAFDDGTTPARTSHWPPEPEPVLGTVTVTVFAGGAGRDEVRIESAGTLDADLVDAALAQLRRVRAELT